MALSTNALIDDFDTQDSLANTTSLVSDGSFSDGTNDLDAWTNSQDAREALGILLWQYPSGTVDEDGSFELYARLIDVDGTVDTGIPTATHPHIPMGSFPVKDVGSTATNVAAVIFLDLARTNTKSSQVYHFYVLNQSNVSMSAGWDLTIAHKAPKPK